MFLYWSGIRSWNVLSGSWERSMDVKWMKKQNWRLENGTRSCTELYWSRGSTSIALLAFPSKTEYTGKFYHQVELGTHHPQTQEKFLSIWVSIVLDESRFPTLGPPNGVAIWRDSRKWRKQGSAGRSGYWEWAFESLFWGLIWSTKFPPTPHPGFIRPSQICSQGLNFLNPLAKWSPSSFQLFWEAFSHSKGDSN